jgi:hypothetical protein
MKIWINATKEWGIGKARRKGGSMCATGGIKMSETWTPLEHLLK